jgi:hypothetical protein
VGWAKDGVMNTTETDANGYIPLEHEDEWKEERHSLASLRRPPKRSRQRLRLGRRWKRKH